MSLGFRVVLFPVGSDAGLLSMPPLSFFLGGAALPPVGDLLRPLAGAHAVAVEEPEEAVA